MPNAVLSLKRIRPVEKYDVMCKRGYALYNQYTNSFVYGHGGRLRSVTVQNVHGQLKLLDRRLDAIKEQLICQTGMSL